MLLIVIIPSLIWLDMHLFKIYYRYIFNDKDDFQNSVKYTLTPDIFSLFKGEYFKDKFSEAKLSGLILFCIITIFIEILIVRKLFNIM
ncbi:hypothetical protein LGK97_13475 [Clostridium sp. CS001]|uniref:hypothetical protein n=1 Tax=Clostridium sp. CS001 TaxID=2880648 RepID=UPI001CF5F516|nr:hypothetical protein [Clostridium sp. CS001]MCB2290751.1 hypothetical protein [Clostridium sp. CS001]